MLNLSENFFVKKMFQKPILLPVALLLITLCLYLSMFFVFLALDKREALDPWASTPFPVLGSDSQVYAKLANNLVHYRVFSNQDAPPFHPDSNRTPGYPLWVAFIQATFGSLKAVSVTQIIMTALTSLLILAIGKKFFSQGIGFMAALLYILDPVTMLHSLIISTEVLFIFLLLIALYLLFFAERKRVFLSGITLGFVALVKPIGLFLPFIFIPFFALTQIKTHAMKKVFMGFILFISGYAIVVSPWVIRNKVATGVAGISAAGLCNVMKANLPKLLAIQKGSSFFEELGQLHKKHHLEKTECSLENTALFKKVFFAYLKEYPIEYFKMHVEGALLVPLASSLKLMVYEVSPLRKTLVKLNLLQDQNLPIASNYFLQGKTAEMIQYYSDKAKIGFVFLLEHLFWFILSLFAILSFFLSPKDKRVWNLLFMALIIYFCILISPVPSARYRLLLEPFLLLLSMIGFNRLVAVFK